MRRSLSSLLRARRPSVGANVTSVIQTFSNPRARVIAGQLDRIVNMFNYEHVHKKEKPPVEGSDLAGRVQVQPLRKAVGTARPVMAGASALAISNLSVRFGARTILDAINFDVREGEFLCIVGSSGSGKTTLLRVLAGLARPAEGKSPVLEASRFRDRRAIAPSFSRIIRRLCCRGAPYAATSR